MDQNLKLQQKRAFSGQAQSLGWCVVTRCFCEVSDKPLWLCAIVMLRAAVKRCLKYHEGGILRMI